MKLFLTSVLFAVGLFYADQSAAVLHRIIDLFGAVISR
jgi:hypothetical protein